MEKIEVLICSGTTCFVMGSSYLNELYDILPQQFGDKVIVKPSLCLGQCSESNNHSKAPYVKVGGEVISEATVQKVVENIKQRLAKNE